MGKKISEVFFVYPENDDFIQLILDAVYDASMSHHKICTYYTGEQNKSLFMTTSFLKVQIDNEVQPIGVTVLFSDVTELGELRDAAAALDKIKVLNQKLERLSYLDELTGLPNRRFFNDTCNREWYSAIQDQKPIAFIMIDIDYFKEINDNYGHGIGDKCLSSVSKALGNSLYRPNDMVARYGGDEFIVVLPNTDIEEVIVITKSIQNNISELNIENSYSPFKKLTVSIGAAGYVPEKGSHWENLLAGADKALNKAKQNGKNQILFL
ncbi:hypothetical protein SDC9_153320 [bioreactor metagenome]|uniref:GGDEF domain-containing protein n=1 Tax=bioreactor metagenome TaxID=1076179 RepID=A0A645EVL6_9ZZZZ